MFSLFLFSILLPRLRKSPPVYFVFFWLKDRLRSAGFSFSLLNNYFYVNGQFASLVNFKIHR